MYKITKRYDKTFKINAAKRVIEDGKKNADVAKELGLLPQTLNKWTQAYKNNGEKAFVGSGRHLNTDKQRVGKYIRKLEEENAILKKSRHLSNQTNQIYEFILENQNEFSVTTMCTVLEVSKSGYYAWRGRLESDQERRKRFLTSQVKRVYIEHQAKAGSPKITDILTKSGITISQKTVSRILKDHKNHWKTNYTDYNKVGLTSNRGYISYNADVVLDFPHKDCVLQHKNGNKEFLHHVLAESEIDQIISPKVFSNIKKYDETGEHEITCFKDTDNLVIKANNLVALHTLKKHFKKKIKLIYIDPPYNTKSYHLQYNDYFSHSTWLTFMKNRLDAAKELLREDGAIFIHCDDNEQAYLKVLSDEIFGRDNFINQIVWKRTSSQQNSGQIARVKDYILIISKDKKQYQLNRFPLSTSAQKAYKFEDKKGKFRIDKMLDKSGYYTYDIQIKSGKTLTGPWVYRRQEFKRLYKSGKIYWSKNGFPYKKTYLKHDTKQVPNDFWGNEYGTNQQAVAEIHDLFQTKAFNHAKPELLMYHLLKIGSDENDLILDFFMGSGTTQAVAHKMNRRYLGVEQMDYIHDVPIKRLKKVIHGEQGGISKKVNWQGGGSFVYAELEEK